MALFRKKNDGEDDGGDKKPDFQPQPEKARKWFNHASAAADSTNYAYALQCYASGLKLDPEVMSAHEAMFAAATRYAATGGKPASSKEVKSIDDGTPVGKFAAAEFAWLKDLNNGSLALKAIEAAVEAEQLEWGHWAAERALLAVRKAKKPSKSMLLQARDACAKVGAWDQALLAGQLALQLDPNDNDLAAALKDLAAQRAMDQGGYADAAGKEGGFRKFVKDSDKQQELIEEETLGSNASIDERNLLRAQRAFEENPDSPDALNQYAQLIKKEGTPKALEQAFKLYMRGYEELREYRFRMAAGDIRIGQARAKEQELQEKLQSNGTSDGEDAQAQQVREAYAKARKARLELESSEYRTRAEKYPTDRNLKFRLGLVEWDLGNYGDAMECFQKSRDEPKLKAKASYMLGRCFAKENWYSDAISEFREALAAPDMGEERNENDIRYELMLSLMAYAREEQSAEIARDARDECSLIARRDISYRDIRDRRRELDELVKELSH